VVVGRRAITGSRSSIIAIFHIVRLGHVRAGAIRPALPAHSVRV
jgi:hypothetical protein